MRVSFDERFRPAVGLKRFDSVDEAIASTYDTNYGLPAAVITEDLDDAARFAKEVDAGNTQTNSQTHCRADPMPCCGLRESGFGKEGPNYAASR